MAFRTANKSNNTTPLLFDPEINCSAGISIFSAYSWPSPDLNYLSVDLSVCSPISRDPISLPSQVRTSYLPSPPSHQKIHTHTHTHTHTNIIFSPFDVYFNHSHQFTMLVWESVFSWLAIFKKSDLWRHNSKLSDLFYSVTGCPGCTSPGSLILGRLSLSSLLILPPSLILPPILVSFSTLIQFLTCTGTEKTVWLSCFLHLLRLGGIWLDFLSHGSL